MRLLFKIIIFVNKYVNMCPRNFNHVHDIIPFNHHGTNDITQKYY